MADKVDKPKKQKSKAKQGEKGVMAALPSQRPERIGGRRGSGAPAPKTTATTEASKAAKGDTTAKPAAKKSAAKPRAAGARETAATKPRATATRRKAAAPRTFEPTQAAETAAGAADERAAGEIPPAREERTDPRPRPVREGAPGIGTAGDRDGESAESGRPSGADLASTAARAAGEVAQLGLTIGSEVLKRVVDRLPRR